MSEKYRSSKELQSRIDKIEKQIAKIKEIDVQVRMATDPVGNTYSSGGVSANRGGLQS